MFWYLNAADHRAISVAANGDVWAVAYQDSVATPLAAHEIVYQPRHGVLDGVVETAAVSALNPAARWAHCTNEVPVRRLYYTPDAGFTGTDTLIAEQVTHSGRRALFQVDIQVDAARSAAAADPAEPDAD